MAGIKYGAYGELRESVVEEITQAETAAVYIGTAPVNLVRGWTDAAAVNSPVNVKSMADAYGKVGYSDNWSAFTLCEALNVHFWQTGKNIGPIYLINVLNPAKHKKEQATTKSVIFVDGKAEFVSETIVLDTLAIEGKKENVDYTLDYSFSRHAVLLTSVGSTPIDGTVEVTFDEVDPAKVTAEDIIGDETDKGVYTGAACIKLVFPKFAVVPSMIAAPGWSDQPEVHKALLQYSYQINGHWYAMLYPDIPLTAATIQEAIKWKTDNHYDSEYEKPYWPQVKDSYGKIYHLSTLAVAEQMRVDQSHDGVPAETNGNKEINAVAQYFGENSLNQGFDQEKANTLTESGVSTAIPWGGRWVLWGDHSGAYVEDKQIDARGIFDVNIRMLMFLLNNFQQRWAPKIDVNMDRAMKDTIINVEQERLDAYAASGYLLGSPQIVFLAEENSTAQMMNGQFVYTAQVTPTPPMKGLTCGVAYTSAGFDAYFE